MGRLASGLARLGCVVAAITVCGAIGGCFDPGIVPDAWTPAKWVDPFQTLDRGRLTVWVVVPHGNPFGLQKPRIASNTQGNISVSTSELPAAMRRSLHPNSEDAAGRELEHDPQYSLLEQRLQRAFPNLELDFEDVSEDDVVAEIRSTPPAEEPDAVLGSPLPLAVQRLAGSFGITVNSPAYGVPQLDAPPLEVGFVPQVFLLRENDREMARSQAFAFWISEGSVSRFLDQTQQGDAAAEVAVRALRNCLRGRPVGADADEQMLAASWSPPQVQSVVQPTVRHSPAHHFMSSQPSSVPQDDVQVDVMSEHAGGESAEVMLRATTLTYAAFDIHHAMLVLRMDESGHWKVLHIAVDLSVPQQRVAMKTLARAGEPEERILLNEGTIPQGISQAAPIDGDQRPPLPFLWWDNLGGATLQVVEWQPGGYASNLFFVPDSAIG